MITKYKSASSAYLNVTFLNLKKWMLLITSNYLSFDNFRVYSLVFTRYYDFTTVLRLQKNVIPFVPEHSVYF